MFRNQGAFRFCIVITEPAPSHLPDVQHLDLKRPRAPGGGRRVHRLSFPSTHRHHYQHHYQHHDHKHGALSAERAQRTLSPKQLPRSTRPVITRVAGRLSRSLSTSPGRCCTCTAETLHTFGAWGKKEGQGNRIGHQSPSSRLTIQQIFHRILLATLLTTTTDCDLVYFPARWRHGDLEKA